MIQANPARKLVPDIPGRDDRPMSIQADHAALVVKQVQRGFRTAVVGLTPVDLRVKWGTVRGAGAVRELSAVRSRQPAADLLHHLPPRAGASAIADDGRRDLGPRLPPAPRRSRPVNA